MSLVAWLSDDLQNSLMELLLKINLIKFILTVGSLFLDMKSQMSDMGIH